MAQIFEGRVVGPLQIVEEENQRAFAGKKLEEPGEGGEPPSLALGRGQLGIGRKIGEFLLEFRDELGQLASPRGGKLRPCLIRDSLEPCADGLKQRLIGQCAIGGIGGPLQGPNPPGPLPE
jgi:hypothetical protein